MSQNSYKNIKKYAAFLFMVFTVLSGSSEDMASYSYAKLGRKVLIDILAVGRASLQDAKPAISRQQYVCSENDNDSLRIFLDAIVDDQAVHNMSSYIMPLTVFIYFSNNIIQKNNLWKSTVF
jgi:hypothetical protein